MLLLADVERELVWFDDKSFWTWLQDDLYHSFVVGDRPTSLDGVVIIQLVGKQKGMLFAEYKWWFVQVLNHGFRLVFELGLLRAC